MSGLAQGTIWTGLGQGDDRLSNSANNAQSLVKKISQKKWEKRLRRCTHGNSLKDRLKSAKKLRGMTSKKSCGKISSLDKISLGLGH